MNTLERRIKKMENPNREHEGYIRILDLHAISVIYRNDKNGTDETVPCTWAHPDSREALEYLERIERYRKRRAMQ